MYMFELGYVLTLVAQFYELFKICKLSKMFPEDAEIDKALKRFENVAFLKITINIALCTLFYILNRFFGFNDVLIALAICVTAVYGSFVDKDVEDVKTMIEIYRADVENFKRN